MDEARFGQKGRVCHRWFTRGQRPPGLCDQRYSWTHLFAAVRPASGEGFALVLPEVSAKAMDEFLARWFHARVAGAKGRMRRIMLVAMARKLIVSLWRYVTCGTVPEGAVLKA